MPKFFAHGTTVEFNSVEIGGIQTISLPSQTKGEVETTAHDSNNVREFIAGLRDSGTVTLEMRQDPDDAGQDELRSNYDASGNTLVTVVITLPSSATASGTATYTFDAYVQELGGDLPGDTEEAASLTATLRVSGAVTKAVA